tara:strand:- start:775 stop:1374 length:600 start_codon:yes stop_codon:yes gene_type:complete
MAITLNGTTGIASVDASVAAPSVRGTDGNTGISYGADSIKFSTGGVERMAISNTGVTGGGKILKVEGTLIQTSFSTSTTGSWVATGIKDSITPSAASSKIIVLFNSHDLWKDSTTHAVITVGFKVAGGSASYLGNATNGLGYITGGQSGATSVSVLHTPSYSLGQDIEYEMYGKAAGGGTLYMGNGNANVGVVLMEVAA